MRARIIPMHPQNSFKAPPGRPNAAPGGSKCAPRLPKVSQRDAKGSPKSSQEAPWSPPKKRSKKRSFKKASEIALFLKKLKYKSKLQGSKLALNLPDCKKELEEKYNIKIDYLEFRDEKNLKLNNFKNKYRLFVAYKIDNVRLIDNY